MVAYMKLYAVGVPTTQEMEAAETLVRQSSHISGSWGDSDDRALRFHMHASGQPRVELHTMSAYCGPGYPRGDWPSIEATITAMRTAFPGWPVHYGSDLDDEANDVPEVNDHLLNWCRAAWQEAHAQQP